MVGDQQEKVHDTVYAVLNVGLRHRRQLDRRNRHFGRSKHALHYSGLNQHPVLAHHQQITLCRSTALRTSQNANRVQPGIRRQIQSSKRRWPNDRIAVQSPALRSDHCSSRSESKLGPYCAPIPVSLMKRGIPAPFSKAKFVTKLPDRSAKEPLKT